MPSSRLIEQGSFGQTLHFVSTVSSLDRHSEPRIRKPCVDYVSMPVCVVSRRPVLPAAPPPDRGEALGTVWGPPTTSCSRWGGQAGSGRSAKSDSRGNRLHLLLAGRGTGTAKRYWWSSLTRWASGSPTERMIVAHPSLRSVTIGMTCVVRGTSTPRRWRAKRRRQLWQMRQRSWTTSANSNNPLESDVIVGMRIDSTWIYREIVLCKQTRQSLSADRADITSCECAGWTCCCRRRRCYCCFSCCRCWYRPHSSQAPSAVPATANSSRLEDTFEHFR